MTHPNAFAAAVSSGLASLLVWLLHSQGITLNPEQSSLAAGAVASAVLFVGRRGLKGAFRGLWSGFGIVWNGQGGKRR